MISFRNLTESLVQLDEAVAAFNDLPGAWKKYSTFHGLGGEGSKVETILSKSGAASVDAIEKVMRKALNPKGASDTSALVWVEINGDPLLAAMRVGENEINLLKPSGEYSQQKQQSKMHGTGKWSGSANKYIPPVYSTYETRSMKPTEAVSNMFQAVNAVIRGINDSLEEPHKDHFDVLKTHQITLEVKVLTVDRNREAIRKDRADAKGIKQSSMTYYKPGAPKPGAIAGDTIKTNRKAVLKKYVEQKIAPIVDGIKADVAAQIDAAIEGGKDIDLKGVQDKLATVGRIVRDLNSTISRDNVEFSRNARFGTSGNKAASYEISSLIDALKKLSPAE